MFIAFSIIQGDAKVLSTYVNQMSDYHFYALCFTDVVIYMKDFFSSPAGGGIKDWVLSPNHHLTLNTLLQEPPYLKPEPCP